MKIETGMEFYFNPNISPRIKRFAESFKNLPNSCGFPVDLPKGRVKIIKIYTMTDLGYDMTYGQGCAVTYIDTDKDFAQRVPLDDFLQSIERDYNVYN